MIAWIKKLLDLKARARAKPRPLTAERFRNDRNSLKEFRAAIKEGNEASGGMGMPVEDYKKVLDQAASRDTWRPAMESVRGYKITCSIHQSENDGWLWIVAVSGCGSPEDLATILETLGVPPDTKPGKMGFSVNYIFDAKPEEIPS